MDMKGMEKNGASDKAAGNTHRGSGVVKKIDSASGDITIAHEPIKTLGWPAMTMSFKARDPMLPQPGEAGRSRPVHRCPIGQELRHYQHKVTPNGFIPIPLRAKSEERAQCADLCDPLEY